MSASFAKTITEADIVLLAGASGDNNAVHINEEFALGPAFRGRIAHGMLTASVISAAIAPACLDRAPSISARACASRRLSVQVARLIRGQDRYRAALRAQDGFAGHLLGARRSPNPTTCLVQVTRTWNPKAASPFKNRLGLLHYLQLVCTDPRQHGLSVFKPEPTLQYRAKAPKLDWLLRQLPSRRSWSSRMPTSIRTDAFTRLAAKRGPSMRS
jgi:hypothetical protein